MKSSDKSNSKNNSQTRGAELKQKMIQSEKEGDKFRASRQGNDAAKIANTSGTTKPHKANR